MSAPTLREVTRQAARERISAVAIELFAERGYDATTVEEIAAAAGISERTFFRYFATKDEAFFSRASADTQTLIDHVLGRPLGEAPWVALQSAVDRTLQELDLTESNNVSQTHRAIIARSPDLLAHQFTRLADSLDAISEALWERWAAAAGSAADDPHARILIRTLASSMLSALNEVMSLAEDRTPEARRELVRETLDALRPGRADLGGVSA